MQINPVEFAYANITLVTKVRAGKGCRAKGCALAVGMNPPVTVHGGTCGCLSLQMRQGWGIGRVQE